MRDEDLLLLNSIDAEQAKLLRSESIDMKRFLVSTLQDAALQLRATPDVLAIFVPQVIDDADGDGICE